MMQIKALGGFMERRGGELRLALRTTLAGLITFALAELLNSRGIGVGPDGLPLQDPVNSFSGNLLHRVIDLALPSRGGLPLGLIRTYNSRDERLGLFGKGWTSTLEWQVTALDAGTVGGMYLGIFLTGCLFLSLGCFASAISRTQMAAAMISFVLGVTLFSMGFLAEALPATAQWQSQVISYFGLFEQMHDFARGVVDTRTVVFYVSATFFFLFLTLRAVESQRWK